MHFAKKTGMALSVSIIIVAIGFLMLVLPMSLYADSTSYIVGGTGQSGGYVFYDKGYISDGWRYLEAATIYVRKVWHHYTLPAVIVGATGTIIGTGEENTKKITDFDSDTNAARYCFDYSVTYNGITYDDWFMPSKDELHEMWLKLRDVYPASDLFSSGYPYWSSSENLFEAYDEWFENSTTSHSMSWYKDDAEYVIPIRAFSGTEVFTVAPASSQAVAPYVAPVPVRTHEMTCWQVWVNENNNFEFIFWWEYYNNNWVKIYDMEGNEVFSIDMEKGNAHFEAVLPDGFYTVKTFHDGFEKSIQEFIIGK